MIIGTAGHIDHGKTSLVKALTGVDTDRLKEEKKRGITIELGFAYQTLKNGKRIGFVDVPGHEKLIHTMLTGAGSIDFVMMVIAADDGVMPQTREHLDILQLMGIQHGLVALTRIDLVDSDRLHAVKNEIDNFTLGSFLENASIYPVCSLNGDGIDALRLALDEASLAVGEKEPHGRFRHAVDRVFTLAGQGTIVTGTVISGSAENDERLVVAPIDEAVRLRSIHVQDEPASNTCQGDRAALNLSGDNALKEKLKRGYMVVDSFLNYPTTRFDARLHILKSETKILEQWFPVRLHHGALETNARLVFLQGEKAMGGDTILAQIVTEKPLIGICGDRIIIRDISASRTIGGGILINPFAPARRRRSPQRLAQLQAMEISDHALALDALLAEKPYFVDWVSFCRARNLSAQEANILLDVHELAVFDYGADRFVLSEKERDRLRHAVMLYLEEFHVHDPDLFGVGLEKLRRDIAPQIKAPFFKALIEDEIEAGLIKIRGAWIGLASHEAKLGDDDEKIWQKVEPFLIGEERFRPQRTRDFAQMFAIEETHMRRILKSLSRMGRLYEVAQDYFFPREVLAEIIMIAKDIAEHAVKGEFVAADLRDRLDNGRKVTILILEFFDRHGVTIRRGDIRRLNPHRLDLFS